MLWLTLWFTVILKIPALYVAYLIWWSVKDPPAAPASGTSGALGGGAEGPRRGPRAPAPGRSPRPHGSPHRGGRRPVTVPSGRARTR